MAENGGAEIGLSHMILHIYRHRRLSSDPLACTDRTYVLLSPRINEGGATMDRHLLFAERDLSGLLAQKSAALAHEMQRLTDEQLADANHESLVQSLVTKYGFHTPTLAEKKRYREGPV